MATNPTGSTSSLVERVKNILLQPKAEWPRIDAEPTTIADIYKNYVLILAAIGPIASLIGQQAFGYSALGISYKPALSYSIATAVLGYVMSLVMIYVLALIIDALAPTCAPAGADGNASTVSESSEPAKIARPLTTA